MKLAQTFLELNQPTVKIGVRRINPKDVAHRRHLRKLKNQQSRHMRKVA